MKIFGWLYISVFIVIIAAALALTADNSLTARGDMGWGNTDWGDTGWRNTDWSNSGWGNTEWGNTGWDRNVQRSQSEYLKKITLGVKKPDGSCAIVVMWANTSDEAMSVAAKNCQGCMVSSLMNSDTSGTDSENVNRFCQ